ncbi:hypothetical protein IO90_03310 [Chryseobacterium sp. FH1]|nr:hypothetical protein IO90_03310 [Chryseobacterium sp. FH1]
MTFTLKRGVENLTQRRKNYEFDVLKVAKFLSWMKSDKSKTLRNNGQYKKNPKSEDLGFKSNRYAYFVYP